MSYLHITPTIVLTLGQVVLSALQTTTFRNRVNDRHDKHLYSEDHRSSFPGSALAAMSGAFCEEYLLSGKEEEPVSGHRDGQGDHHSPDIHHRPETDG